MTTTTTAAPTAQQTTPGGRTARPAYVETVRYDPGYGHTADRKLADLTWRDNCTDDDTEYARINRGTILRRHGTERGLTVKLQDPTTGKVRTLHHEGRVIDAFMRYGLSATHCRGIDGWLEMALMPGTAGRD